MSQHSNNSRFSFVHTADWHFGGDPKKNELLLRSVENMNVDSASLFSEIKGPQAILICGDIFDKKQSFTSDSGVAAVRNALTGFLSDAQDVFIVKGNNAHDAPGSVELLDTNYTKMDEDYNFNSNEGNVITAERPTIFVRYSDRIERHELRDNYKIKDYASALYVIYAMPYPSKEYVLDKMSDYGVDEKSEDLFSDSIDIKNRMFEELLDKHFTAVGNELRKFRDETPKVFMGHLNMLNATLQNNLTVLSQDIVVHPASLEKLGCDYYALGHIHKAQSVGRGIYYSGNLASLDWGDVGHKSFNFVRINSQDDINVHAVSLNAPIRRTMNAAFENGELTYDSPDAFEDDEIEKVMFRVKVKVHEYDLVNFGRDQLDMLRSVYGDDVVIQREIIPAEKTEVAEEFLETMSLVDETKAFAKARDEETVITESLVKKIEELEKC